jgi:hypothetical protein
MVAAQRDIRQGGNGKVGRTWMLLMLAALALDARVFPGSYQDGQALVKLCTAKPTTKHPDIQFLMNAMSCQSYIGAVVDDIVTDKDTAWGSLNFCYLHRRGIDNRNEYLRDVVVAYFKIHPAALSQPAAPSVRAALLKTFDCKKD